MNDNVQYQIIESEYNKFIEINGTRMLTTPMGISLKNNKARYFIINQNNSFIGDFVIYNEDNWITLSAFLFKNEDLIEIIFSFLKTQKYDYLITYLSIDDRNLVNTLEKKHSITKELVRQGNLDYYKIKFLL